MARNVQQKLDEETKFQDDTEEVTKMGKYQTEGAKPMNMTLKSWMETKEVLASTFKPIQLDDYRNV